MVGEIEPALERTGCDTAMQEGYAFRLVLGLALTGDEQRVLLDRNVNVIAAEASNSHGNTVIIITQFLDVVRGVGRCFIQCGRAFQQAIEAVKANG